jgi:hypothetical protein
MRCAMRMRMRLCLWLADLRLDLLRRHGLRLSDIGLLLNLGQCLPHLTNLAQTLVRENLLVFLDLLHLLRHIQLPSSQTLRTLLLRVSLDMSNHWLTRLRLSLVDILLSLRHQTPSLRHLANLVLARTLLLLKLSHLLLHEDVVAVQLLSLLGRGNSTRLSHLRLIQLRLSHTLHDELLEATINLVRSSLQRGLELGNLLGNSRHRERRKSE